MTKEVEHLQNGMCQMTDEAEYLHGEIAKSDLKNSVLEQRVHELEKENKRFKEKYNSLESHSRRNNLKFVGFEEDFYENPEARILDFLQQYDVNLTPYSIERAHRLGPYSRFKTRPIIVKFLHFKDREHIWQFFGQSLGSYSRNKIRVFEDFPEEVEEERRILVPIAEAALRYRDPLTHKHLKVQLNINKLYINHQMYTCSTLHQLPEDLKPASIFTPFHQDKVAFFSKNSPLSNHFPAPFTFEGDDYVGAEQFIMAQKAKLCNDREVLQQIMAEPNPVKQKALGKTILKGINKDAWHAQAASLITPGITEKFRQNTQCRELLLKTGNRTIIEASPHDNFFGVGLPLRSRQIWDKNKWNGKNVMGSILEVVRGKIRV
jgi:hypothetical protein